MIGLAISAFGTCDISNLTTLHTNPPSNVTTRLRALIENLSVFVRFST